MLSKQEASVVLNLYNAFYDVPKPEPLASLWGSYCHEQVEVFNKLDWEEVTFDKYMAGYEGWIMSQPATVTYLLPRLFRMIFEEHPENEAIHNVTQDVEFRLTGGDQRQELSVRLNVEQKRAIVDAFKFMDNEYFENPDAETASNVAAALGL